jgi:hypothetical protein
MSNSLMNQISLAQPLPWRIAISIQEISDCFAVMSELRPHLSLAEFIDRVRF